MKQTLQETIEKAPLNPGVYIWKDASGKILYVGKADNLRARLKNYARPADPKTARLVERAASVETIITKTDTEALILEDALVKQNQPRYNVRLRDDKRYPYVKVTIREKYPRIEVVRRVVPDGSRYFGPYADAGSVRRVVKALQHLFGIRKCAHAIEKVKRPCINYAMGICSAPCGAVSGRQYAQRVKAACEFLSGKYGRIRSVLLKEIKALSEKCEFEKAARLKETLDSIESISSPQDVSSAALEDMDILGYASLDRKANITQIKVRSRKVVAVLHHGLAGEYTSDPSRSMKAFIKQHYTTGDITPKKIYVSVYPEDGKLLEGALNETLGAKVKIMQAFRGKKRKLLEMAVENSMHQLELGGAKTEGTRILALKQELYLSRIPRRIEGYDISNIGGDHTVGGMVVFTGGKVDKNKYRRFKIKGGRGQDDPRNMAEMIERRFKHTEWGLPDLILLDGGPAQLNACIKHIPKTATAISLAKKFEKIYVYGKDMPLRISKNSPSLLLLRAVRDEAHRYARAYHVKRRGKEFIKGG